MTPGGEPRRVRLARPGALPWPAVQLVFAVWLLYALAFVGLSSVSPERDASFGPGLALLQPVSLIRSALFIGLGGFALLTAVRALRALISQWRADAQLDVVGARTFLSECAADGSEYVLVLRPSGAESMLFLPSRRRFWARLRDPATGVESVEQLIAREASRLGLRTVAPVEPGQRLVAPGPEPIELGNDSAELESMIARAWCVVLMIPPGAANTPVFGWEVQEIFRKGLIGRAALLLPPRELKRAAAIDSLVEALVPHADPDERMLLAEHLMGESILVHLTPEPESWGGASGRFGPFARGAGRAYARAIAACLREVAAVMPPRPSRYPYFHATRGRMGPRLTIVPPAAEARDAATRGRDS
ncbi:hypothetical protein [Sphingomonas sp.]|uniref:hypothetical protein n=1 Tax=Sphingomonas sp. TaxID=28214 RepID=UPI001B13DBD2|nr:hypothetical protein [Sphingomonas sp.]MBO9711594.1 hypothetical protein [Sphingomonas sp.]